MGFVQTKQGGCENCWGLHLMRFPHHLHHLLPSTSNSPPLWQWVYRKLASTKTWWAYKSPAADRGRCLASCVGGDQDLITLCHRALGWKTQTTAGAKMASGLKEQAPHCDLERNAKHSDGHTKEHGLIKYDTNSNKKWINTKILCISFWPTAGGSRPFHLALSLNVSILWGLDEAYTRSGKAYTFLHVKCCGNGAQI